MIECCDLFSAGADGRMGTQAIFESRV